MYIHTATYVIHNLLLMSLDIFSLVCKEVSQCSMHMYPNTYIKELAYIAEILGGDWEGGESSRR